MQETSQNINWFLFGIKQHERESQPPQIKLSDASPALQDTTFSLSQAFSLPLLRQRKWSCFYLCSCRHLEMLAWQYWQHTSTGPLSLWRTSCNCRSSAAPSVQRCLLPNPTVSKQDNLSYLQSPVSCSLQLITQLAVPALNTAPILSILRPSLSSPWCVHLSYWSHGGGEHLPFTW